MWTGILLGKLVGLGGGTLGSRYGNLIPWLERGRLVDMDQHSLLEAMKTTQDQTGTGPIASSTWG